MDVLNVSLSLNRCNHRRLSISIATTNGTVAPLSSSLSTTSHCSFSVSASHKKGNPNVKKLTGTPISYVCLHHCFCSIYVFLFLFAVVASSVGKRSVDVNPKQIQVAVTGYVDPNKVLKKVNNTAKRALFWPYIPYNLAAYPYVPQAYSKKDLVGYVKNVAQALPSLKDYHLWLSHCQSASTWKKIGGCEPKSNPSNSNRLCGSEQGTEEGEEHCQESIVLSLHTRQFGGVSICALGVWQEGSSWVCEECGAGITQPQRLPLAALPLSKPEPQPGLMEFLANHVDPLG